MKRVQCKTICPPLCCSNGHKVHALASLKACRGQQDNTFLALTGQVEVTLQSLQYPLKRQRPHPRHRALNDEQFH